MNVLLVEDDFHSRSLIAQFITQLGHQVTECIDGQEALEIYEQQDFPLILSDICMPHISGIELLQSIASSPTSAETCVVLFTGHGDMESAIAALRAGAYDYLLKPIRIDELAAVIKKVQEFQQLRRENKILSRRLDAEEKGADLETSQEIFRVREGLAGSVALSLGVFSQAMQAVIIEANGYHQNRNIPVLIEGETGTGKELLARLVHYGQSGRDLNLPFVAVNCAAFSDNLFESEFFGYEAGSFSGGLRNGKKGKLDLAQGGTLFLDEIGDLPLTLQAKLLRVIQEKEYYRVGGLKTQQVDIRLLCATNTDLAVKVQAGTFRQDLYYRLAVGHIFIPPLRERREEILPLTKMFLERFALEMKQEIPLLTEEAVNFLKEQLWPGNVRELRNLMEWLTVMQSGKVIDTRILANKCLGRSSALLPGMNRLCASAEEIIALRSGQQSQAEKNQFAQVSLAEQSEAMISAALQRNNGNKMAAAKELGISVRTLYYRLQRRRGKEHFC